MDIQDFINNFAEQFDNPPSLDITPFTEFKGLDECNSLVALSVICMVDEEYDKTINGETIRQSKTIQDLYDKIFNS